MALLDALRRGPSKHWIEDCIHWWGRVLTGKKTHWCPEWDDLPIDETCDEFKACLCYEDEKMSQSLVRLVGGCAAGEEVWHDVSHGSVIRRAKREDFPLSFTSDVDVNSTFEQEDYYIHKIVFDAEGHHHYYAAPGKQYLIDIMNKMWDGYKDAADMEKRNGH